MPFCPSCKYEYRPDIKKCPDCDVALVDELPAEAAPPRLVSIANFPFDVLAHQARLKLDSHGITAVMSNEKMSQMDISVVFADGGVHLLVREEDAAQARKILEEE